MLKLIRCLLIYTTLLTSSIWSAEFYWLQDGKLSSDEAHREVKLGSLWKLYAYAYLKINQTPVPDFFPTGEDTEEIFCGKKGDVVTAEKALAQSCGLYFEPKRLGLAYKDWKKFWNKNGGKTWYSRILIEQHQLTLPISEILKSLDELRHHNEIGPLLKFALSNVVLNGTARVGLGALGSRLVLKTFTVGDNGHYVGGFAGWTHEGPVVWYQGQGKSHEVIERDAGVLSDWLTERAISRDRGCVKVKHFARYPIKALRNDREEPVTAAQELRGLYTIEFTNGKKLNFTASAGQGWDGSSIHGSYQIDDYVARVVEREFGVTPMASAEAMAIVARSYLYQNATKLADQCWGIEDSTHFQRVGIHAPSQQTRKIVIKTSEFILDSEKPVHYHLRTWLKAKKLAEKNTSWPEILGQLYPEMNITMRRPLAVWDCLPMFRAEKWMARNKPRIDRYVKEKLHMREIVDVKVCQTPYLQPFSLMKEKRIFLNKFEDSEDQISLVHEYFHFYLSQTHRARDEKYIDQLAKEALKSVGAL